MDNYFPDRGIKENDPPSSPGTFSHNRSCCRYPYRLESVRFEPGYHQNHTDNRNRDKEYEHVPEAWWTIMDRTRKANEGRDQSTSGQGDKERGPGGTQPERKGTSREHHQGRSHCCRVQRETVTRSFIPESFAAPIPFTESRSSTFLNLPCSSLHLIISAAVLGPIPGSD